MPTYEYRCKSCAHQFDIVQSFTDDALTECPSCHEASLKKVFGNVGITFKGSGFYKTDSRSAGSFGSAKDADKSDNGSGASSKPDAKPDAAASSGSTSSSDAKPAATSSSSSSSSSGSGSSSASPSSSKS